MRVGALFPMYADEYLREWLEWKAYRWHWRDEEANEVMARVRWRLEVPKTEPEYDHEA